MKTWRYDVDRNVVLMTEDGILFAKTTWGNYTYKFETPGVGSSFSTSSDSHGCQRRHGARRRAT